MQIEEIVVDLEKCTEYVGWILDSYGTTVDKVGVAAEDPADDGIPMTMQAGEVDDEGWVRWILLPSTLTGADVAELEREYGIQFPTLFRGYLLARFHFFEQVKSKRHDQQILIPPMPAYGTLDALRSVLTAWRPMIDAGFIPFAEWGDGWGPICFDSSSGAADGESPVVWFDQDRLVSLGEEACARREDLQAISQPLYDSCREFLLDVFGHASSS
jgi:hypothetical protein